MLFDIKSNFCKFKSSEVKNFLESLNAYYGADIEALKKFDFYVNNSGKVYITSVPEKDLTITKRVCGLGLYFATIHDGGRIRLSVEGCSLVEPKKNYIILNEKGFKAFICAEDLFEDEIEETNFEGNTPFIMVIYAGERIGIVSKKESSYINYLPKSRKLDYNKVF
ncbi:MAG: hypothetical protein ACOCXG_03000 [Nanoarchaeota archaeon]